MMPATSPPHPALAGAQAATFGRGGCWAKKFSNQGASKHPQIIIHNKSSAPFPKSKNVSFGAPHLALSGPLAGCGVVAQKQSIKSTFHNWILATKVHPVTPFKIHQLLNFKNIIFGALISAIAPAHEKNTHFWPRHFWGAKKNNFIIKF